MLIFWQFFGQSVVSLELFELLIFLLFVLFWPSWFLEEVELELLKYYKGKRQTRWIYSALIDFTDALKLFGLWRKFWCFLPIFTWIKFSCKKHQSEKKKIINHNVSFEQSESQKLPTKTSPFLFMSVQKERSGKDGGSYSIRLAYENMLIKKGVELAQSNKVFKKKRYSDEFWVLIF